MEEKKHSLRRLTCSMIPSSTAFFVNPQSLWTDTTGCECERRGLEGNYCAERDAEKDRSQQGGEDA